MERNGNTLYDQSRYSNNGTITGATSVPGKKGTALSFDGVDDTVPTTLTSNANFQSNFTVSAWIKQNDKGEGGYGKIIDKGESFTDANGFGISMANADDRLWVLINSNVIITPFGYSIPANKWNYITVVLEDHTTYTNTKIYHNGELIKDDDTLPSLSFITNSNSLTIGNRNEATDRTFNGIIDEVRIYNRVLTTSEITALYREGTETIGGGEKGLIAHYPLDSENQVFQGTDLLSGWDFTSGWSLSNATADSATQFTTSIGNGYIYKSGVTVGSKYRMAIAGSISTGNLRIYNSGTNNQYKNLGISGGSFDTSFTFTALTNGNIALLTDVPATVTITSMTLRQEQTADATPNSRHGTITAGVSAGYSTDRHGQANKAYDFDGASTDIDTGLDSIGTSATTISAWVYLDSWGEGSEPTAGRIISNGKATFNFIQSTGVLRFSSNFSTGATSAAGSITTGNWYHVAVTRTSASPALTNLYINGTLSGTANQSSGNPTAGTSNVHIGNNSATAGSASFDGKISDVKIFNRVLSATEIRKLYDQYDAKVSINGLAKGLIGHWELTNKWANGTTIQDLTPNNHTGTASNVTVGGRASDFNGTTSTIPTTIMANDDFQNGFTIGAWINLESDGEPGFGNPSGRLIDKSTGVVGDNGVSSFIFSAGGNMKLGVYVDTVFAYSGIISLNQWKQVLITVTESGGDGLVNFYINGVHSGNTDQNIGALSGIDTSNPLTIGNRSTTTDRTFDGQIADVRLYDHVLSTTEITQLYNMGRPRAVPRTASFDDGSSQYLSLADSGSAGSAQDFDTGTSDFAVEFWMKSTDTDIQTILGKKDHYAGNGSASNAGFSVWQNVGGYIIVSAYDTDSNAKQAYSWSPNLSDGAWHHVLIFFDRTAGYARYYRDGGGPNNLDISDSPGSFDNTQPFKIGAPTQYFDGNISHVRFYNFPSGAPSTTDQLVFEKYNAGSKGRIHPDLAPYLTEAWDLEGDNWARNESSHNLTNNNGVTFVKP